MAFLNTVSQFIGSANSAIAPLITAPGKMWHLLILNVFSFIGDYGWRIVVFTVLLKLVLSPLDFFQRYKMNKNQKITDRLRPTLERLQKQCGNDKQAFQQKQMELNRREGYSYFSSCLPMIATMVIFITLWLSMQTVAQYMTLKQYAELFDEYQVSRQLALDEGSDEVTAVEVGQNVVYKLYYDGIDDEYVASLRAEYGFSEDFKLESKDKVQASFLWVKNIWAPDVPWGDQAILSYKSFITAINKYSRPDRNGLEDYQITELINAESTYNTVMAKLLNESGKAKTNGYLVLPILVVLLSVGSQLLSMFQQKRAGQMNAQGGAATSMKVMMFIMPVMMLSFALTQASIFTLYMATNTATTLVLNALFTAIIRGIDNIKRKREYGISTGSTRTVTYKKSPIIHYVKGANPHAGERVAAAANAGDGGKKAKKQPDTITVMRGNRPDPTELLNRENNVNSGKKKK